MGWLKFIVQRKILVGLVVVLIGMIGSFAILKLDKELLPPMDFDGAYISVNAGDMAAIEVERTITNPLEQKLQGIDGVEDITSTTNVGASTIDIIFERGRVDELYKEVEAVVNSATADITEVNEVVTGKYGTNQSYEFYMDVTGEDMDQITEFASEVLKPRLEELPEVREVALAGIQEYEVSVVFDRDKVKELGLDVSTVIHSIQEANSESTVGALTGEQDSPSLRWNTKLNNAEDVKNLKVPVHNEFISLDEIANVTLEEMENSSTVWKNGSKDFIFVQVGRVPNVTQIEMADAIRAEVKQIKEEGLVTDFELNEMVAQADYVQESIDGVVDNILIGGAIALFVLLLFLRNIRATIIIGISIPTSVLLTFTTMWIFGYSINMLTMIALGLGIGMMVDSSIVILESIYSKKEQGLDKLTAVIEGVKEVATAVLASMLTTIVVFLPIGLLGGEMGQFMIILSVVVAITLISSVIVAFTLIPAMSEKFLGLRKQKAVKREGPILRKYSQLVAWTVRKKRYSFAVISIFALMFVGSLALVTKIPMSIMPDIYNRYNELMVTVEPGLSAAEKEEVVTKMNSTLMSIGDVESNYVMDNGNLLFSIINMTKADDITREQVEVNEEIMSSLRKVQDTAPIKGVVSGMEGGGGSPVQVNIKGESYETLQQVAEEFTGELEGIEGLVGITSTIERTTPEQVIELKEAAIEDAGLSQLQVKQFMEQAFLDMPISEITNDEQGTMPLKVKWDQQVNKNAELLDLTIPTKDGEKKLSSFITLTTVETPNEISHVNGERMISITADIEDKDLGTVNRAVQKAIDGYEAPSGYSVSVAGNLEEQQELLQQMIMVLALAIFLVYLVMAVQFNHLLHPIVVMSVIPMTFVGVILGLFVTQRDLSIMSGMGIVMLIGIVLNNAILLIDRTNQLRNEGYGVEDALVEAGKNRIRPIFMTTLTTVGGMLPLALASGTSGNYQAPMATVIISGLLFATLITLLLIPAVYRLFTRTGKQTSESAQKKQETIIEVEQVKLAE